MKALIFTIFLFITITLNAQFYEQKCVTVDDNTLKSVPVTDFLDISNEPIKTIRINLIFLRKDDGTGGFQQDNSAHQQYINEMVSDLNSFYSNIPNDYNTQCYNGSYGVYTDSKIRFDVVVMYLNNTTAWDNHDKDWCPDDANYHLQSLNNQIAQNSSVPRINVFFTEDSPAIQNIVTNQNCPFAGSIGFQSISCSQFPVSNNLNLNQSVHMRNRFSKYYWMKNCVVNNNMNDPAYVLDPPTEQEVYSWVRGESGLGLAHELGHSLSLAHTSPNTCSCLKHLMMNQSCGIGHFISPKEIASIHHALCLTSLRRYVTENTYSSTPISINQNITWSDNRRIYRGLSIQGGAAFQLSNELVIPSETDILVTGSGSSFTTSGATIHTPHTNSTLDLIVQQNASVTLNSGTTIQNCNVSVQSGSLTLNNANIDISSSGSFSVALGSQLTINQGSIY
jgi:hypothetical protein